MTMHWICQSSGPEPIILQAISKARLTSVIEIRTGVNIHHPM